MIPLSAEAAALRIVILDDDLIIGSLLQHTLAKAGNTRTQVFTSINDARESLALKPDVVLTDCDMGPENGLDLIKNMRQFSPDTQVIMVSGLPSLTLGQEAASLGAFDFIRKEPAMGDKVLQCLEDIVTTRKLFARRFEWMREQ